MLWQIYFGFAGALILLCGLGSLIYDGEYIFGIPATVLGIACLGTVVSFRRSLAAREAFLIWLAENVEELMDGKSVYYGYIPVSLESKLVTYQFAFSLVIYSRTIPSQFFVAGYHDATSKKIAYCLFSLLFGWWTLWAGPIFTVQVLYKNLRGGITQTVREVIDDLFEIDDTVEEDELLI